MIALLHWYLNEQTAAARKIFPKENLFFDGIKLLAWRLTTLEHPKDQAND
jgi:hypothetical protein